MLQKTAENQTVYAKLKVAIDNIMDTGCANSIIAAQNLA
jgi:hypothetical protein